MSNESRVMSHEYTLTQKTADAQELQFLIKSALGESGANLSKPAITGAVNGMRRQLMPLPGEDPNPVGTDDLREAFKANTQDVFMGMTIGRLVAMACRQGRMHVEGDADV